MATERFLKLSQDKKDRILQAARHEFARVPFEDASINQIIKEAEISRGSFYTYFEDKMDLLHYVFREEGKRNEQYFRELLRKQGNYWEALRAWVYGVQKLIVSGALEEDIRIMRQSGMMQRVLAFSESGKIDHAECAKNEWFRKQIDPNCFRHGDRPGYFAGTIRLGNAIGMMTAMALVAHAPEEHAGLLQNFETGLAILREGADPHFCPKEGAAGDAMPDA